jgi:hypothetical protein
VDGPCFVSGIFSDPAAGRVVAQCVTGGTSYVDAEVVVNDEVRTAIDDPHDTSFVQATIFIVGEKPRIFRRVWLYDVKNVIEIAKGRSRIH